MREAWKKEKACRKEDAENEKQKSRKKKREV